VKIHYKFQEISSRTGQPISVILGTHHSWVKEVQVKGQLLFKGEIISKLGWGHIKILGAY
jgi:hypothetical protein